MLTATHCIVCDRPTNELAAIVLDANGPHRLFIGLCCRCMEAHGGRYSDEVSDKVHERYAANPGWYFARPVRTGRLQ